MAEAMPEIDQPGTLRIIAVNSRIARDPKGEDLRAAITMLAATDLLHGVRHTTKPMPPIATMAWAMPR